MAKYRNIKSKVKGIVFDSQLEGKRYIELKILLHQKKIKDLELQVVFELLPNIKVKINGNKSVVRKIKYISDFKYYDNEKKQLIVEDVKGIKTRDYIMKMKMFLNKYGDRYIFREYTKKGLFDYKIIKEL